MNDYLKAGQLAGLLGVSTDTVYRMTREDVLHKQKFDGERGDLYPLAENVQAYIAHVQLGGDDEKLKKLRIGTEALRARKLQKEVALMEGQALSAEAVEIVMNDMLGSFRTRIRALPLDVAPKLGLTRDQREALAVEIDDVLTILSDYRKEDFLARNPQYAA